MLARLVRLNDTNNERYAKFSPRMIEKIGLDKLES